MLIDNSPNSSALAGGAAGLLGSRSLRSSNATGVAKDRASPMERYGNQFSMIASTKHDSLTSVDDPRWALKFQSSRSSSYHPSHPQSANMRMGQRKPTRDILSSLSNVSS